MAKALKKPVDKSSKKPSGKAKPKPEPTPTPMPSEQEGMYDPSKVGVTLALLCSRWPSLNANERTAYRALATDEQRSRMGAQTKAERVLGDAIRWAVQIDEELKLHPDATDYYSPERFAYFLERIQALHERLTAEQARRHEVGQKRGTAVSRRDLAIAARKRLIGRMQSFAGERQAECNELNTALGTIDTDDHIGESILALTTVATSWVSRTDAISQVLLKDSGLTQARIAEAVEMGKALTSAGVDATMGGNLIPRDSPLVNRDEGDVLLEMAEAMRRLDLAREDNPAIKKLIPGPGTRHILASRPKKAATRDEPPPAPKAP